MSNPQRHNNNPEISEESLDRAFLILLPAPALLVFLMCLFVPRECYDLAFGISISIGVLILFSSSFCAYRMSCNASRSDLTRGITAAIFFLALVALNLMLLIFAFAHTFGVRM